MDRKRLKELLTTFTQRKIVVVGDYFLDKYLEIDPKLTEKSLETNKDAYQVVGKRCQPGAAGTVMSNLAALCVGALAAVGVIGEDGEGYDLTHGLKKLGVDITHLMQTPDRFTPTYTKPMLQLPGGEEELERQDIKNRTLLPEKIENEVLSRLKQAIADADGVIVQDQVQERNCGVVTDKMRELAAQLADENPQKIFFADSRVRIGEFRRVTLKPNRYETAAAVGIEEEPSPDVARKAAMTLSQKTGRPVFMTMDKSGIIAADKDKTWDVPAVQVEGPIDIVGAGDSTTAGAVSALISGASLAEAAAIGCLVASVTIRQIGTTGTATPAQVLEAFDAAGDLYAAIG
ncbi:MAG: PfkB family carbohydrate kinase [bacterium]